MVFEVKALSAAGQVVVLRIDASVEAEARRQAELRGMSVFMARPVRQGGGFSLRPRRAGLQVLPFVQELLTLLRAGLTLVSALEAIAEKESNPAARASVAALLLRLRRGGRLSEALAEPGNEFPQILVAGIRASERTGNLDEALQRYCDYAGRMDDVRKMIVAAMIYPTLLLVVGLLVSAFLIGYVVPKFASVYRESGGEMPWASALLLDIGRVIGAHTFLVLAGTGMFVVALLLAWSRPATRAWLGARVRQLPGFGPRIRVYEMARLYRTLAMLLRGGTPIVPALGLASSMLSVVMRAQLARSAKQISQGAPLSRAFESNGLTTAVGNRMLGVGERGGGMADMLERIADYHDEETARWVDWVSRLFEPIMMAVLGLVIGGIVILLYMPIFDLAGSVQ
jgi:general secretion pathway protein F